MFVKVKVNLIMQLTIIRGSLKIDSLNLFLLFIFRGFNHDFEFAQHLQKSLVSLITFQTLLNPQPLFPFLFTVTMLQLHQLQRQPVFYHFAYFSLEPSTHLLYLVSQQILIIAIICNEYFSLIFLAAYSIQQQMS